MVSESGGRYDEGSRTSIWSVRTQDRFQFSIIFFILFLIGLSIISYYEIWVVIDDSPIATAIALIRDIGAVGLASLVLTLVRFEGGDTIMGIALDLYRKHRYEAGFKAGIEEGRRLEREAQHKSQANDKSGAEVDNSDGRK